MHKIEVYPYQRSEHQASDNVKTSKRQNENKIIFMALRKMLKHNFSWDTLFVAIAAGFMGRAMLLGELLPFSAALFAAVAVYFQDRKLIAFIFSIIGLASVTKGFHLASAISTLFAIYILLPAIKVTKSQQWLAVPMQVFTCTVIVKTAFTAYFDPAFYNYVVIFFEALLAGIITFLSLKAVAALKGYDNSKTLSIEELICLIIMVTGLLMGISDIEIKGLALKNIINYLIILVAALVGGSGMGAAVGTVVGFIPSITTMVAPTIIGVYAFAGVLGGVFRSFGKLGVSLGFLLGLIIFSIYVTDYYKLLLLLSEAGVALGLFFIIPSRVLEQYMLIFKGNGVILNSANRRRSPEVFSNRLKEVATVFNQLGQTFEQISSGAQLQEKDTLQDLFNKITSTTCQGCANYNKCWEAEFYNTYQAILDLFTLVEVKGHLLPDKVGGSISKRCIRLKELITSVNCLFETFQTGHYWETKLRESRQIVSGQLKGVAKIMEDLAAESKEKVHSGKEISKNSFVLSYGVAKAPKSGSVISGDSYSVSPLPDGRFLLLLSDGMGVGPRAAQESSTTVNLLEKLLQTGFDKDLAVKTVNSILLLRSSEEIFATVDLALVDLHSGETDFLKIGSVASFIKTGEHVEIINSASLPIGIINNIEVETTSYNLLPGDILVMITDGLIDLRKDATQKEAWLKEALRQMPTDDPQKIANLLLLEAKEYSQGNLKDDMLVIVARLDYKNKN